MSERNIIPAQSQYIQQPFIFVDTGIIMPDGAILNYRPDILLLYIFNFQERRVTYGRDNKTQY